jgi:hypothetical protein
VTGRGDHRIGSDAAAIGQHSAAGVQADDRCDDPDAAGPEVPQHRPVDDGGSATGALQIGEKVQCPSWTSGLNSRPIGPKSSTRIVAGERSATDPDGQVGRGHHLAPAPRQG